MNYYLICYEMPKIRKLEKNIALVRQIATMYLKKISLLILTRTSKLILKGAERENRIFFGLLKLNGLQNLVEQPIQEASLYP